MKKSSLPFIVLLVVMLVVSACGVSADKEVNNGAPAPDADNTARNSRDSASATQTPPDQGESEKDREISANIRKAIVADDSLSTNAHNVKIITNRGTVTLRGPVKSTEEKAAVEARAKQVAGVSRVDNMLEVESAR
jgi:hyperosmotically inducible periplasmic protein